MARPEALREIRQAQELSAVLATGPVVRMGSSLVEKNDLQ